MNDRIEELRETWEKAYKGLVKDLGNERTFEEVACMFFELGWRAACESTIYKCVDLVDEFEDKFKKEMAKCL
jgi:GH24 family phage-related lysozyme (muramidase)